MVDVKETAHGHIGTAEEVMLVTHTVPSDDYVGMGQVESLVREYFRDIPIMAEVARCESTFTHYKGEGEVIRGLVDQRDTGVMQINSYYHEDTMIAMGLDITNFNDNLAYARDLYERQGVQPWNASRPCWGSHLALAK